LGPTGIVASSNPLYLPNIALSPSIEAVSDPAAMAEMDALLVVAATCASAVPQAPAPITPILMPSPPRRAPLPPPDRAAQHHAQQSALSAEYRAIAEHRGGERSGRHGRDGRASCAKVGPDNTAIGACG
jgi:hypothetical protein